MRLRHLTEGRLDDKKKMGRVLNHLEDLVFFYGSDGADEAIDILNDLTNDETSDVSIKWDGNVALFYGRDPDGTFMLGTKGNWAKNTPATSAEEIRDYIANGGKGEDFRGPMSQDLYQIFPYLEASFPTSSMGFVMGDLIFSPAMAPKVATKDGIQFKSNQVTYTVDPTSEIGGRINSAICGIALHVKFSEWGSKNQAVIGADTVAKLNSRSVVAMGQSYAPKTPKLDHHALNYLSSLARKNGKIVDALIAKRPGISDISNIIYTFNNQTMRGGGNELSTKVFFDWLATSKVSAGKQAKLAAIHEENPNAFNAMFELFNAVADAKQEIISQLDAGETDIRSSMDGRPGGEGYVSLKNKIKLVPRKSWRPS